MSGKRAADERGALRECPFCGGTPGFSQPQVFDGNIYGSLWCRSCGATVYVGPCGEPPYDELEEKWNRRHERTARIECSGRDVHVAWTHTYHCGGCGSTFELDGGLGNMKYCPCCGARVVGE